MKMLTSEGVGISTRQAQVLTFDNEEILWEQGLLGYDTPEKLLNTLVFLLGMHCALCAGKEY